MARLTVQQALPGVEVKRLHRDEPESERSESAVKKLHRAADGPLRMAKAKAGAVVKKAIEGRPLRQFGTESLMSGVCSGEKVPEYLARIVDDKLAKRKMALALLEDDTDVIITTTITFPTRKK